MGRVGERGSFEEFFKFIRKLNFCERLLQKTIKLQEIQIIIRDLLLKK